MQLIWRGRLAVSLMVCVFAAGAIVYALLAKDRYRAEVVMVQTDNSKSPSGNLAQLAGAASLIGLNINSGGTTQAAMAVLQSKELTRKFIERNNLLKVILADKVDQKTGEWKATFSGVKPDIRDAVEYFQKHVLSVDEDKRGVVNVTITWTDAAATAAWANALVKLANEKIRDKDLTDAERNIAYLNEEMKSMSAISLQQAAGRIMESEMQKMMVARGNEEYAFKVVDQAVPPKKKYWPPRVALVIASAFIGFVVSIGGLFILAEFRALGPVIAGDAANS